MASHDEQISRFWDELTRGAQPLPELDASLAQPIERFQHRYAVSPPESTRERVRQRVLQSQSTSHEMESAMNLDAATLPPINTNGRTAPLPLPQRPAASQGHWLNAHGTVLRAAVALMLLAALIGGILIYAQGDRGEHPAVAPATSSPAPPRASSWLQYRNGPAHTGVASSAGPAAEPLGTWSVPTQGAINSEPAIKDRVLYIGSEDGHLYALDTSTGEQQWAFDAGSSIDTSPTVGDALVYATDRSAVLHAIDLATGESAWTFASANPNAAATLAGGVLYVAGDDTNLYALDAATGAPLWTFDTGANTGRTPAVASGVVYLGTENGQLFAVDAKTGQQHWVFSGATGTAGSTVVDGAAIYQPFIHGSDDRLYALDATTGAALWSFGTPAKDTVWVPAVAGDTLYAPSNDGNIYALDAKTGAIRWQFAAEGPAESSGVLDDATFYVADDAGYLYALDRETGIERWRLSVDDGATKGPALVDGVLYIGTTLGVVHAFAAPEPNVIGAPGTAATPIPATPSTQNAQAGLLWSMDESNSPFGTVGGLSVDPEGRLWVFDSTNTIFNPRLDPATSVDFDDAIVLDNAGSLYVLDYFAGTLAKFALHAPLAPATPAAT